MTAKSSESTNTTCAAVPVVLNLDEQNFLGQIARASIEYGLREKRPPKPEDLPTVPFDETSAVFAHLGAFVTLTQRGALRGCIGNMIGRGVLWMTVARMAFAAAFQDYRFPQLQTQEWSVTKMEISVLGPLSLCPNPEAIEIGRHGLMLSYGQHSGVFLPQVPVEQGWDRLTYLQNLCLKAGLPLGTWQKPDAQLYWYEAFVFTPQNEKV